jgi:hypothetical protein
MKKERLFPRSVNDPSETLKKSSSCVTFSDNFNQSLITRIRGVSRCSHFDLEINKNGIDLPNGSSKLTKSKYNF